MRCRAILLLALVISARVAMAINDPPYYLFPLYYTKVCLVDRRGVF